MRRVSFRELLNASPGRSLPRWLWFQFLRSLCLLWFKLCYRWKLHGKENFPLTGAVLIVANHQSTLDSVVMGLAVGRRPVYSLARRSLFKPVLSWLFRSLNGIPVDRGAADLAAMRRCVQVLRDGMGLMLFPEGTRTETGEVGAFRSGVMLMVKRGGPDAVVPLAISGSFAAWPRGRMLPRPFGRITARWGTPVPAAELLAMNEDDALARLRDTVATMAREMDDQRG